MLILQIVCCSLILTIIILSQLKYGNEPSQYTIAFGLIIAITILAILIMVNCP